MLHGYVWKPECKPVGVIQVIHGMTEYIGRYEEFAAHFYRFRVCCVWI